jgi:hypothetical protein
VRRKHAIEATSGQETVSRIWTSGLILAHLGEPDLISENLEKPRLTLVIGELR